MRITYFTDAPRIGGAERFLADLIIGARDAGHEVTLVSPQDYILDFVAEQSPGVGLLEAGRTDFKSASSAAGTMWSLARGAPTLGRALKSTRPTLLHVNNGGYPGSDLCRLAALVAPVVRIPVRLLTVNSAPLRRDLSQPQLQAVVDWMLWHAVDRVHATTRFVEAGLQESRGMPSKLGACIPYGVAEPQGSPKVVDGLRRSLIGSRDPLLVGMVSATGDREKGHHVLLEALARVGVDIHAVLVGPHPGEPFVRQIAELRLGERATLVGPVSSEEVGPYLRAVDLVVVPSTAYESLPLVVLEAMAAGKPVFASRLSGIPEAVLDGETGRLFRPGASDELASLLRGAVNNGDELVRMGRAGRARWMERFTPDVMTSSLLLLYEELAKVQA